MAPSLLLVLGVLAYPVAWEVWVSLTDFSSHSTSAVAFVGLANYSRLVTDVDFWSALLTTVLYFAVTTAAKLVLGVALALLLARPGRGRAPASAHCRPPPARSPSGPSPSRGPPPGASASSVGTGCSPRRSRPPTVR